MDIYYITFITDMQEIILVAPWLVPPVPVTRIDAVIEWSVKSALVIPDFHGNNGSILLLSDTAAFG